MVITNDLSYPKIFMDALEVSTYSRTGTDYSGTELIRSPRIVQLERRHHDKLQCSASSLIKSFMGTAIHDALERRLVRVPNTLYSVERRYYADVLGRNISGKFDAYLNKVLYDFKTTSVWKRIKKNYKDWENQLNLYAWLLHVNGVPVKQIKIIAIYTDWDSKRVGEGDYPSSDVEEIDIPLWSTDRQERFVYTYTASHIKAESLSDEDLPLCTKDDMWERDSAYAVMRPGQKKALRVLYSKEAAEEWIAGKEDGLIIEHRPGERVRCQGYCRVTQFCSQFKEYVSGKS